MQLKLDKRFQKRVAGTFGKYEFQVGVLKDKQHMQPKRGERGKKGKDVIGSYAGGKVRHKSNKPSGVSVAEVSEANRERLGFNFLQKPFEKKRTEIVKFLDEFFKLSFGRSEKRRAETLL